MFNIETYQKIKYDYEKPFNIFLNDLEKYPSASIINKNKNKNITFQYKYKPDKYRHFLNNMFNEFNIGCALTICDYFTINDNFKKKFFEIKNSFNKLELYLILERININYYSFNIFTTYVNTITIEKSNDVICRISKINKNQNKNTLAIILTLILDIINYDISDDKKINRSLIYLLTLK